MNDYFGFKNLYSFPCQWYLALIIYKTGRSILLCNHMGQTFCNLCYGREINVFSRILKNKQFFKVTYHTL